MSFLMVENHGQLDGAYLARPMIPDILSLIHARNKLIFYFPLKATSSRGYAQNKYYLQGISW